MIRGSAFSVILHGLLLAAVVFGLPHIVFLVTDEPPDPPTLQVATVTPEQAAAIDQAAARPLAEPENPTGGKSGLSIDALNTETPEDRRTILQSTASERALNRPDETEFDAKTLVSKPTSQRGTLAERLPIEPPVHSQTIHPQTIQPMPAVEPAPARPPATEIPETPTQSARTPEGQSATPPSAMMLLAGSDSAAQAMLPLFATLPGLDAGIGAILAAQSRDPAAAAMAAQNAPALQLSIERMRASAEQGYAHAQFSLAEVYLGGNGQPRDLETGKRYLLRASLNGYLPAQLMTAALAAEGNVLPRDLGEAHAWLSVAADQGSRPAAETLERLEREMSPRESLAARQRRNQLRQVFLLTRTAPTDPTKPPPPDDRLRVATTLGDIEAVHVLLAQGSNANKPDEDGRTAAIEAAWRGYVKILDALLEQGADIRLTDGSGKTALMWAAINGHAAIVDRLLAADAAVNAQDREGATALMRAAWNGHVEVVRLLLHRRADPRLRDRSGKSALDHAAQARQTETLRLLQDALRG